MGPKTSHVFLDRNSVVESQNSSRIETAIIKNQTNETINEQARRNEEDKCQANLHRNQNARQITSSSVDGRLSCLTPRCEGDQRRQETEKQTRYHGNQRSEAEESR